jgi:enoyl-CoA hydratase/carnithine racemase
MPAFLRERDGHVETWTLNLPDRRNTITDEHVVTGLEQAVDAVNADRSVRAVILTGAGSAFSAGGNIHEIASGEGMFGGSPYAMASGYRYGVQRVPRAMARCEVPVVAAVNGPAVGAGCDLAVMCDLRVASSTAFFAESFVKLGLVPGDGGAWFLTRAIGPTRAAEMALTGDRVDAETARSWGLVSAVVPPEDLMATARLLADRVAVNPPHAVRLTKQLLGAAATSSLEGVLDLSASMQALAHHTEDHHEAVAAFLEKRDGVFTGA